MSKCAINESFIILLTNVKKKYFKHFSVDRKMVMEESGVAITRMQGFIEFRRSDVS